MNQGKFQDYMNAAKEDAEHVETIQTEEIEDTPKIISLELTKTQEEIQEQIEEVQPLIEEQKEAISSLMKIDMPPEFIDILETFVAAISHQNQIITKLVEKVGEISSNPPIINVPDIIIPAPIINLQMPKSKRSSIKTFTRDPKNELVSQMHEEIEDVYESEDEKMIVINESEVTIKNQIGEKDKSKKGKK